MFQQTSAGLLLCEMDSDHPVSPLWLGSGCALDALLNSVTCLCVAPVL